MTPTATEIAHALIEEMKRAGHRLWVDPEKHAAEHEFLAELIKERHERRGQRQRLEERIAGSLVLSFLLVVISTLGYGVMDWLRKHL